MVDALGQVLASSLGTPGEAPGLEILANAGHSSSSDERDLVSAAQRSPEAFARIYERHVDAIYRYLRLRVGSEAEDLTQQVFLRALAALPRYQSRGLPSRPGSRIARNVAADHSRLQRRTSDALLPTLASADASPRRPLSGEVHSRTCGVISQHSR